jgi:alpha-1,2-mannosyltransferase
VTMIPSPLVRPFPLFVLASAAACAAVIGFTAGAGLSDSMALASFIAAVGAAVTVTFLARRPGFVDAVTRAPRPAHWAFVVASLAAAAQFAWMTPFILDPTRDTWATQPGVRPMPSRHSCVSSYWLAGVEVQRIDSIYAESLYSVPQPDPKAPRVPRKLGPFNVDQYEYPPPFLLLPRALMLVASDFWHFQRLWFALNLAIVVAGAIAIARRMDASLGTFAAWLVPFVIVAPPVISTLQVGNVQLAIIAASMVAMLVFERGRYALGGLLLAYATMSKLFPGVLVLYLLLRRDWRAVGWTAVWGAVIALATLADFGWHPYGSFVEHLPRLLSGEAFPAFRNPVGLAVNSSVPGITFKLGLFGVPHMDFLASKIVGWIYSLVVLGATFTLARRPTRSGHEPLVWLVIIILATMRSPFLPTYAGFPAIWLMTLAVPAAWREPRSLNVAIASWCVLAWSFGPGGVPPQINAVWTFVQTVVIFGVVVATFRLVRDPVRATDRGPGVRDPVPT